MTSDAIFQQVIAETCSKMVLSSWVDVLVNGHILCTVMKLSLNESRV